MSAMSTIPAPADPEVDAFDVSISSLRAKAMTWICPSCHDTRAVRVECEGCGGRGTIGTADCDECAGRGCVADECPNCAGEQSEDVPELDERDLELKITEDREERR